MLPPRYNPISASIMPGGFGTAESVHDSYLDRVVIYKSMKDEKNNKQLTNEIRLLSHARSRHIVEIYDVIIDKDGLTQGIIIEKLTGQSFHNFYKEAKNSPKLFLLYLYQIATALADLHESNIIHRDLKLDNFKESESGILKLFDFGISVDSETYKTRENRGTLVYAAPELFLDNVTITKEMDIYALGVCAWALCSQEMPKELHELPPQTSSSAPSIMTILGGLIDKKVITLIDNCLSPEPSSRPKSREISNALANYLVQGQHKGIFVHGSANIYELSNKNQNVNINLKGLGGIKIIYDGLDFIIDDVTGNVSINNKSATIGSILPASCVLAFGAEELGYGREWITFSSSQPEVVI
ncbi:serine/threonine protein kinase [Pseudomonas kairouanensis]|uniref:Serine/threonine protein kinase n=1 Tax=Pseudomonas kairouanensis TaxID=2293832 RepID=A0A4Z0AQI1_9PSED|nr:protein kinase [Pseudomonas kairouanensis]TFY88627.1 serine/threonine protein kinase [Pseudomonas kairouanensis]